MVQDRWGDISENSEEPRTDPVRRRLWLLISCLAGACVLFAGGWMIGRRVSAGSEMLRVIPGEFEHQEALLLSWPDSKLTDWTKEKHRGVLSEIVKATRDRLQVIVLAGDDEGRKAAKELFEGDGVGPVPLQYLPAPASMIWVRDFGPLVAKSFDGGFEVIDTVYPHDVFPEQDAVPAFVAQALGMPLVDAPLVMENGNFLSNGAGLCVVSDKIPFFNAARGKSREEVSELMRKYLGAREVVYLESLHGEPNGHVDMYMTFTSPDTVVIGQYNPVDDEINAAVLDRNAQRLSEVTTACGPLKVHRLRMPRRVDDLWYTFTNVVYANGVLLLPSYGDLQRQSEAEAEALYARLLPGWEIVKVDCSELIRSSGSLHCATMNVYRLPHRTGGAQLFSGRAPVPAGLSIARP